MVYVICCNDSLKYASTDKEKAENKLNEMKNKNTEDNIFIHIHEVEEL